MDALGEEEVTGARVVKLFPVVALDSLDVGAKLGGGVCDEVGKLLKVSDLSRKGKVHK